MLSVILVLFRLLGIAEHSGEEHTFLNGRTGTAALVKCPVQTQCTSKLRANLCPIDRTEAKKPLPGYTPCTAFGAIIRPRVYAALVVAILCVIHSLYDYERLFTRIQSNNLDS